MNAPNPIPPNQLPPTNPSPSGWKPTQSTMGGAILGTAIAQLVTAIIETYSHVPLSAQTASAITTVCVALSGYVFTDGGRK